MLEIRIDAMVRRIGSKPPGTNSIVSLSIPFLPFLVADISGGHHLVGLEYLAHRLAGQIAVLLQPERASPDGWAQPPSIPDADRTLSKSCTSVLVLPIFFGQTLHRLDKRIIVRQLLDAERKLHVDRTAFRALV